ncbi:methyltransferase domain-containing protein [Streptomyces sp. NPDC006482]|uniref:methyltransferase domain-containing protein n=1 Tax=unclassified Streptomyces TaxID=2593676 RepID=UPI00224D6B8E|nr:methyltransferase domain-containing protein [Streptomyces sp. NBC_00094]MCX5389204.1 methyltransferase domain-containing protein [Streptomyces sp. NBC_00094]
MTGREPTAGPSLTEPSLRELPGDRLRVRAAGREFVVDASCPHRKGRLAHGHVNPRTLRISCPLHHSTFDLATGSAVGGPCGDPLTVYRAGVWPGYYGAEQVWLPASEQLLEWGEEFHELMLGDDLRMTAFRTAIAEAVRPGDVVLDLGTGTGILARWALEAGAARVYGIDLNEKVLATAAERLAEAGFGDRFHPVAGLSFDLELPERVDIVISEIMGNLADNENFSAILDDARERFLRPGGTMLPRLVDSFLVPVAAESAHAQLTGSAPQDAGGKREFAALLAARGAENAFSLYYDVILPASGHLASPRPVRRYEPAAAPAAGTSYRVPLAYTVQRDGVFTGFKGYFVAQLSDTVALDISGDDIEGRTTSDSWKHCYLPVERPVRVRRGDRIALTFSRGGGRDGNPFGQTYSWEGQVLSGSRVVDRFAHSTGRAAG